MPPSADGACRAPHGILRLRHQQDRRTGGIVNGNVALLSRRLFDIREDILAERHFARSTKVIRQLIARERVSSDQIVCGFRAVGPGPRRARQVAGVRPPQVHAALVVCEGVLDDPIGPAVFDVYAASLQAIRHLAVTFDVVPRDQSVLRIAAPDSAYGILDKAVAVEDIAEGERHLDAMGRSIGEIVADKQVLVVATPFVPIRRIAPGLAQRFAACETEEPVTAVGGRVLGDDVFVVLLEQEYAGRILAAIVHPVAVSAHAEVAGVAADHVAAASPHRDAPAGVEGEIVVVDLRVVHTVEA